jgi:general secretion pathway protein L
MPNEIIGLDFGTYSVKVVRIEGGRQPQIVGYDEERLPSVAELRPDGLDADDQPAGGGEDEKFGPSPDEFESAETKVQDRDDVEGAPDAESADEPEQADEDNDWDTSDETRWGIALERLAERDALGDDAITVAFLPNGQAMSIHQEVPFDDPDKVKNILPHMLDDRLPVETDEVIYDFELIEGTAEEGKEAVIGFARREHVAKLLEELNEHRIDPAVVGVPELLMRYILERCMPDDSGTYALVDIGHTFTRVLVLHEDEPVIARQVRFGGNDLTEAISRRMEATYEQAENFKENEAAFLTASSAPTDRDRAVDEVLRDAMRPFVRDLRRTFQSLYAKTGIQLDTIFLSGGTSNLDNVDDFLRQEFGVDVRKLPVHQLPGLEIMPVGPPEEAKMATAASLALQQVDDRQGDHLINLRREEFSYRGKSSFIRQTLVKYGAAAAVLFLVLIGVLYTQQVQLEAQRDAMRKALSQQTQELFGEPVMESEELKQRFGGEVTSNTEFIPGMSAYQLMYEITKRISDDVDLSLDRLEVDVERNLIQVYGETTSAQAVDKLEDDIDKLECIQKIKRDELTVRDEDEVDFELNITSGCS